MNKLDLIKTAACVVLLAAMMVAPVQAKTVKCEITIVGPFKGNCSFGGYEDEKKGSFWIAAERGTNKFIEETSLVRVIITSKGKGEASYMTSWGVTTQLGTVTRSKKDRACWLFSNGDKICAW